MVLGIAEDFSSNVTLDSQLTGLPESGLFLNSGVHPSITVENLLSFLPVIDFVIAAWDELKPYDVYATSRQKRDIVTHENVIYQSVATNNIGNEPPGGAWVATNIESLRIRNFIDKVQDRVYADLNLTKRLVNNQYLYEVGKQERQLPNDYCGWVFEPKGSDYITLRINEICLQKSGTTPVELYIINQGSVIDTIEVVPKNGKISFDKYPNLTFSGKGKWMFVMDSTTVFSNNGYIDPLKYDGFVAYTCVGIGDAPETATYSYNTTGNGLGFNISAFLNSSLYIENNVNEFGDLIRSTFEYMTLLEFLYNSNNRKNMAQRVQLDKEMLMFETKNLDHDTSVRRYYAEKKKAIKTLERTFDTQLANNNDELEITISSL
jgi:hypothetical protein